MLTFLDQKLILCRYSSCSSSSSLSSLWAIVFKKPKAHIGMKLGRNVPRVIMHRLISWIFNLMPRHIFKMEAMTSLHAEKCCHLASKHEASAAPHAAAYTSSWSIVHLYLLCQKGFWNFILILPCSHFCFCTKWITFSTENSDLL